MSKILVTGASGFIGANLVRKLSTSYNKINIIVRKKSNLWRLQDIKKELNLHLIDLTDLNSLEQKIKRIKPDIVYHCAAYGINPSQRDINTIIQTNVIGTINLMQSLEKYCNVEKLVNVGSVSEYGPKSQAIKEMDSTNPLNPYSISKLTQTYFAQYFTLMRKLPTNTLRLFTAYGMFEDMGRLIPDIMIAAITNKTLKLTSPYAQRDFVFVEDVINALIKAADTKKIGEIFNVGSGKAFSVKDVVDIVSKIVGIEFKIVYDKKHFREFDKFRNKNYANFQKAKKMLNWEPSYSLKQGLEKSYKWFKENIHLYTNSI